eukprot:scaffold129720_cov31-Prasinocladus_malaysianus.AAC.4
MAIAQYGVLFGTKNDDPFGHLTPNVPIEGERCAYLYNVNHKEGHCEGHPNENNRVERRSTIYTSNLHQKHPCAELFADGKNGTTIVFPALAYSKKILKYVKDLCGGLVVCDIQDEDVHCDIFDSSSGAKGPFVKELESIYWLRETLEASTKMLMSRILGWTGPMIFIRWTSRMVFIVN